MITIRKSHERGAIEFDWLKAKHSFSFGSYFDPKWMGLKSLRVINEDTILQGGGFDTHPHRNMEIISFVIDGQLEHKDNIGNHEILRPGEVQIMSAGKGIFHSEFNPSTEEETKMFQIWIEPNTQDTQASYQKYKFETLENNLTLLASEKNEFGKGKILQEASIYLGNFSQGTRELELNENKSYWLQIFDGKISLNKESYVSGDAIILTKESNLPILVESDKAKFILFEL